MAEMKTITIGGITFDVVDDRAVRFERQELTDTQKEQARENIDALGKDQLPSAINTALEQAKKSGEFDGNDGKTAYEYAQDGGYTGTEEEFAEKLAEEAPKAFYITVSATDDGFVMDKTIEEIKAAYDAGRTLMAVSADEPLYHSLATYVEEDGYVTAIFILNTGDLASFIYIDPEIVTYEQFPIATDTTMENLIIKIGNSAIAYNGTETKTLNVTSLKNPYALTINGVSYDGSAAVDITDTINTMIDSKLGVIENGSY